MAKAYTAKINSEKEIIAILKERFLSHMYRHPDLKWEKVESLLLKNKKIVAIVEKMELTGGEPDVISLISESDNICYVDCAAESPVGRRSLCYDIDAWNARKENRPQGNVIDFVTEMGLTLLSEQQYRLLQKVESVDQKTSSWIFTPDSIRKMGGALFCDYRYGQVFVYHNGASSYYAARGFRAMISID
ncbi:MAG: hypothetical protein RLZ05_552 [Bacteroidota bacterium]|jgi:hypothetical protein